MGKIYHICVMGISEGDEKEGETEKVLKEIITENPPNLAKDTSLQILEAEQVSQTINPEKSMPRYVIIVTSENWRQKSNITTS